jgi:hypothetical protein
MGGVRDQDGGGGFGRRMSRTKGAAAVEYKEVN